MAALVRFADVGRIDAGRLADTLVPRSDGVGDGTPAQAVKHHGHLVALPLAGGTASLVRQRTEEPFGWLVLGVDQLDADLVEGDVRDGLEPRSDRDGAHQ
jgi:hypothetical protein